MVWGGYSAEEVLAQMKQNCTRSSFTWCSQISFQGVKLATSAEKLVMPLSRCCALTSRQSMHCWRNLVPLYCQPGEILAHFNCLHQWAVTKTRTGLGLGLGLEKKIFFLEVIFDTVIAMFSKDVVWVPMKDFEHFLEQAYCSLQLRGSKWSL